MRRHLSLRHTGAKRRREAFAVASLTKWPLRANASRSVEASWGSRPGPQ